MALGAPVTGGTFNIGIGMNLSHRELAEMIDRVLDNTGLLMLADRAVPPSS